MGSPLGPVYHGYIQSIRIIMVELEDSIVPKLDSHLQFWKRYVDDTLTVVKEGSINKKSTLCEKRVAFKHRKSTDTGIYLNWFSFEGRGTLKNLVY